MRAYVTHVPRTACQHMPHGDGAFRRDEMGGAAGFHCYQAAAATAWAAVGIERQGFGLDGVQQAGMPFRGEAAPLVVDGPGLFRRGQGSQTEASSILMPRSWPTGWESRQQNRGNGGAI